VVGSPLIALQRYRLESIADAALPARGSPERGAPARPAGEAAR
jgi:hypothetical protein